MKKILVPTDFSTVADNAINYAIEIAAKFKSELYLYHVYNIKKIDYNLDIPKDEQPVKKEVERNMEWTKLRFKEKIKQSEITIHTIVDEDSIFSLFKRKVINHGIDLIVMGSKGASGLIKVIFGTVAATAIEMATVPILVVPPEYTFRPLENIVLAVDHREVSPGVLSPALKLASKFGAKVTIFSVNTGSGNNRYDTIKHHFSGIKTAYHEVPMSRSVNDSINEFIEDEDCDLLCLVRREKGFIESFTTKSITKEQVYNSQVPLLVLLDK